MQHRSYEFWVKTASIVTIVMVSLMIAAKSWAWLARVLVDELVELGWSFCSLGLAQRLESPQNDLVHRIACADSW